MTTSNFQIKRKQQGFLSLHLQISLVITDETNCTLCKEQTYFMAKIDDYFEIVKFGRRKVGLLNKFSEWFLIRMEGREISVELE